MTLDTLVKKFSSLNAVDLGDTLFQVHVHVYLSYQIQLKSVTRLIEIPKHYRSTRIPGNIYKKAKIPIMIDD
jgi:hypothetical protein